ncbi:hypothetical protein [Azospirillum sp. sgz302134]
MPFNGSGVFNRIYSWATDKANGVKINASRMDEEMAGFAAGLSQCITRDGQTTVTADIPFAGHKLTYVGAPTTDNDAATKAYVDAQSAKAWVSFVGATGAIVSAHNVSGVARNSAGLYTITFARPMNNGGYAVSVSTDTTSGTYGLAPSAINSSRSTLSVSVVTPNASGGLVDFPVVNVAIYGG